MDCQADIDARDYVSTYWPNPGTGGPQIRGMYNRLVATDDAPSGKDGSPAAGVGKTNGGTNGVLVKQE